MKKILEVISEEMKKAFRAAGYDGELGKVTASNRPDLCEYQCNGAMAGAKRYKKAHIMIAQEVAKALGGIGVFEEVDAVPPGFLNLKISPVFLQEYLNGMVQNEKFGLEMPEKAKKIMLDYGGPNVAKPLHVGHLRSAIIGESVKRIARYADHEVIGGLQMGLIITELKERKQELIYFDENFSGEYPKEAPFTIAELEEIYPTASGKSKEDSAYKEKAMDATFKLQSGVRGYRALWEHIIRVSVADLKKNYNKLNVEFDLWKGESDVHDLIPQMVEEMKAGGYAYLSEGALVVDVKEESDTREIPPCMILKSDGASLYNTTDLATIKERMEKIGPDEMIYVVGNEQNYHFQVLSLICGKLGFAWANKIKHLSYGMVELPEGKMKSREGTVVDADDLMQEMIHTARETSRELGKLEGYSEAEAEDVYRKVALGALKYFILKVDPKKTMMFNPKESIDFNGNTGPFIQYTYARIRSILRKAAESGTTVGKSDLHIRISDKEQDLIKWIAKLPAVVKEAGDSYSPALLANYAYELAKEFNQFYHDFSILKEEDEQVRNFRLLLAKECSVAIRNAMGMLGIEMPEKM